MTKDTYLAGGYLCPVNDRVREAATDVAGDTEEDAAVARQLFEHVRDRYCWDMTRIVGADTLLREAPTYAMSFSKSSLLVALLRSQGIPARFRLLKCKMYNGYRDAVDDSIHAPAEVLLDGEWVTADPTYGEKTAEFREPAEFGEETWKSASSEEERAALPRRFVWAYNYGLRFMHPAIRRIRSDVRECQEV